MISSGSSVLNPRSSVIRALLQLLLGALIVVGCAFLWIGLPVGGLWAAGQLTEDAETFLLMVLGGIPLAMVSFGWLLFRANAVYLDIGGSRSLIEVAMTASAIAAVVLLFVWFLVFAEIPMVNPR